MCTSYVPRKKRLIILDSLRGLAALIVCFHHFFVFNHGALQNIFSQKTYSTFSFISDLNLEAVLFFFVLSGFCIGLSTKGKNEFSRETLNNYLYRRFKRILPVFWIALAFTWFCGLLMNRLHLFDYSLRN